ncbi:DUF1028 domain-containing protein [Halocalculus aciditolerans]|uniref:DUF1028 domain-containing protein n=1 Tax=Halocalculus aciditolerans TaxID=1383812 RepID=A0A830FJ40_9EURY|nr:DUF1028 domain-containing protein [Halocalculus aciditolerans]GGL61156.1 hypothetical protein GCM10009039_19170 [Halocalculus aciditolerans]
MTFSVCFREETPDGPVFAAGAATDAPAVGALCPYATERGVICTQSFVNVRLGRRGIDLLDDLSVSDAVEGLLAQDDHAELRQVHGLDARGDAFAYSGEGCDGWFGHRVEGDRTAAGNMLTGPETLDAALDALDGDFDDHVDRLLAALAAGKDAGGDKRGHSSAAVVVWAPKTEAYHDLRVDEHDAPIAELRGVYERTKERSGDFSEDSKSRIFD